MKVELDVTREEAGTVARALRLYLQQLHDDANTEETGANRPYVNAAIKEETSVCKRALDTYTELSQRKDPTPDQECPF